MEQYTDQNPPLSPEVEYCYRVSAFNNVGQSAVTESCATTQPPPIVQCYDDPGGKQRAILKGFLTAEHISSWRDKVGLSGADPNDLQLITDDSLCQQIWDGMGFGRQPSAGNAAAFFQLGNRYIVADYGFSTYDTIVADENFNPINPILTD